MLLKGAIKDGGELQGAESDREGGGVLSLPNVFFCKSSKMFQSPE